MLDLDPYYPDPDSVNPDPQHWFEIVIVVIWTRMEESHNNEGSRSGPETWLFVYSVVVQEGEYSHGYAGIR
jgi:hypothetical protein